MGKKYCVYVHTNKTDGMRYVGITCKTTKERWRKGSSYRHNPHFYRAIQKYGWDGFMHDVLVDGLDKEDAAEWERFLIREWRCTDRAYGYNIALGGEGNEMYSPQMKKKMSESAIRRNQDPVKFAHICDGNRRRWEDPSEHEKSSKSLLLYYQNNPERREEISKERKAYFACHPEKKKTRRVAQLSDDGETIKVWNCMTDAAKQFGTNPQNISSVCNGKRKRAGGYSWKYV